MDRKTRREKERLKKGAIMKSRMNKLMSLCLVAMMGTTLIPQPIQAEEVGKFEEESFEEATVEFEEGTFEEESNQVAESNREKTYTETFDHGELKYGVTDPNAKTVEVVGFADGYQQPSDYRLHIPDKVYNYNPDGSNEIYTVTSLGDSLFKDSRFTSLKFIGLPDSLTTIDESAFAGFTSLMTISLPRHLTTIGKSAFAGCTALRDINFSYDEYVDPSKVASVTIGESAFEGCTSLRQISLPYYLTTIGKSAFAGCTALNSVNFSYDDYLDTSIIRLTTIGDSAFAGCTSLGTANFGILKHLTTISNSAFAGCTELRNIEFPKGLTTIGELAFEGCTELASIELPEGLTTIGDSAFALGESTAEKTSAHLMFINIPSSVKALGNIFGEKSPFGPYHKEEYEELPLVFQRDQLPENVEGILDVISSGNYKPTIYFPNTETAISAYAGKNSPFVTKGLINRDYFNSSKEQKYESVQICPGETGYSPNITNFPWEYEGENLRYTSSNPEIATVEPYSPTRGGLVTAKSTGETTVSFVNVFNGQELVSDNNTFKVIVDHEYVWQVTSFPDFFKSGSMYQKCEGGCGKKNEPIKIPSYLKLLEGLIDLDDFDFDDFDDLPSIIMGINEDQEFKSNSTYEVKNESLELIPYPLKDQEMDFEQYECSVTSSNPSVATAKIDEQGKVVVKTVGKGQAKITTSYTKKEETPAVMNESGFINEAAPNTELEGTFVMNVVESEDDIPTGGGSGGGSTGGSGGSSTGGGSTGGSTSGGSSTDSNAPTQQVENAVYRAYNPYNGEHLYTTNYGEFKVITKNGWDDEGIAFMSESKEKGQAVYRVYNPNSGLHHYTTNVNEKNALVSLGWNDEGVAFYTSKNPKDTPVYRIYNGNDGNHHYTMNANEALTLISMGWKNEGIAFLTAPMK